MSNEGDGDVGPTTRFDYHQDGNVIWAEYAGGAVLRGHLVGTRRGEHLHFRYVHLDAQGDTASGRCRSTVVVLADGQLRLVEAWTWESREGSGRSIVEEARHAESPTSHDGDLGVES